MNIIEKKEGDYHVFALEGRLDTNSSTELEKVLLGAIDNGMTDIAIDFMQLSYISSSGLRVLLIGAKKLNEHKKKIILRNMKDHIMEVFDIAGFTPLFDIKDD